MKLMREPIFRSVSTSPERDLVSSVPLRVQGSVVPLEASANCGSWKFSIDPEREKTGFLSVSEKPEGFDFSSSHGSMVGIAFSIDPEREKPRFPSVSEEPKRVRLSSSHGSMAVAVAVAASLPAGVAARPDGEEMDSTTSLLVFIAFLGVMLAYGIFMMFLGAGVLRTWMAMMNYAPTTSSSLSTMVAGALGPSSSSLSTMVAGALGPTSSSSSTMVDGALGPTSSSSPTMVDGAPRPTTMMDGAPLPDEMVDGAPLPNEMVDDAPLPDDEVERLTPSSRRGRSTTSRGSSSSAGISPQDVNDLRGVWAPWPPPDDATSDV